jgi:hypothetical protein
MLFFEFPEDERWNGDKEAVEFSVILGPYEGTARIGRRVFQQLLEQSPTPERCVEAFHLQRTRFEKSFALQCGQRSVSVPYGSDSIAGSTAQLRQVLNRNSIGAYYRPSSARQVSTRIDSSRTVTGAVVIATASRPVHRPRWKTEVSLRATPGGKLRS